jgi:hypothetical protein
VVHWRGKLESVWNLTEFRPLYEVVLSNLRGLRASLLTLWEASREIAGQKEFALKIKDHPASSVLFGLRKGFWKTIDEGIRHMTAASCSRELILLLYFWRAPSRRKIVVA